MSVRPLSNDEEDCRKALLSLGMITRCEWMVALDVDRSAIIAFRTDMRNDSTDPD